LPFGLISGLGRIKVIIPQMREVYLLLWGVVIEYLSIEEVIECN